MRYADNLSLLDAPLGRHISNGPARPNFRCASADRRDAKHSQIVLGSRAFHPCCSEIEIKPHRGRHRSLAVMRHSRLWRALKYLSRLVKHHECITKLLLLRHHKIPVKWEFFRGVVGQVCALRTDAFVYPQRWCRVFESMQDFKRVGLGVRYM